MRFKMYAAELWVFLSTQQSARYPQFKSVPSALHNP